MEDGRIGHLTNLEKVEVLERTAKRQAQQLEKFYEGLDELERDLAEMEQQLDILSEAVWELLYEADDVESWIDIYKMKGLPNAKKLAVDMVYRLKGALGDRPSHIKDFQTSNDQ